MTDIDLGLLEYGPYAQVIREMATKCSDVDFRIAVEPGQMDSWTSPVWEQYLPILPCGGELLRFGERALLHHLILTDGTILDFYVQDTTQQNPEPNVVILTCRDAKFRNTLE